MQQSQFETMARRIRPSIISIGRMILLSEDEAEDIAQDTLLRMWTIRDKLEAYDSVDALAKAIARNLSISRLRKIHLDTVPLMDNINATVKKNPQSDMEDSENDIWLTKHIANLPPSQMIIIKMKQNERLDNTEIAAILGVNETAVRQALSKARRRLMAELKINDKT
jgi:RNA polymerase sigma factor (sigma-70 family)